MESESRELLLRTAERLFAEHGIAAVSLRQINREAGQRNHSAVHYHFGDKMGLLQALCDERAPTLGQLRHDHLDPVLSGDDEVSTEQVLLHLLLPLVDVLALQGGGNYLGLRHQMLLCSDPAVRELILSRDDFPPLRRLRRRLATILDHLTPAEIERRLHRCRLLNGAVIAELVAKEDDEAALADSFRSLLPELLPELVGLMQAPAPRPT